ncbi:MADS-box transcription factor PHERES 2 [Cajanus cajan]|uniref:Agamous-like MADS-box protein AGL36 n=1 Tax=Cajanus cajan TaxID=3821 RepID=A0A151SH33_CAJCA|nr:MADS-box transcription factor PHERES 2 [Cajanus cajan]KYP54055.1 Agamous-like MADS-box protein AGL36 [Cajanus cajan]
MGRERITLKPIKSERARRTTLVQRKKGLMKKLAEFSTLCRAKACLIVYDDADGDAAPVTWPQDPTMVRSIIENYEHQKKVRTPKIFEIQDFFDNRKNMVETEISKVHKKIKNIEYPTWDPRFKNMGAEQLNAFISLVDAKIAACDHKINMARNMHQSEGNFSFMPNMGHASASSSHPSQLNFMHNISQSQAISMEQLLNDNNGRVDFANTTNQVAEGTDHGINNIFRNMQHGDVCFNYTPSMVQERGTSSHVSQSNFLQNNSRDQFTVEVLKRITERNEMVNFTNEVYIPQVPQDSTYQVGESLDWSNKVGDLANLVNGPIVIDDWSSQLSGDLVDWATRPNESTLQNLPVQSQNDQNEVTLPALPPTLDEFQTDYYQ